MTKSKFHVSGKDVRNTAVKFDTTELSGNKNLRIKKQVNALRKCITSCKLFSNDNEGMSQVEIIAVPNPDKNPVANYADLYTNVTNKLEGLCREYGIQVQRNDTGFILSYGSLRDDLINKFFPIPDNILVATVTRSPDNNPVTLTHSTVNVSCCNNFFNFFTNCSYSITNCFNHCHSDINLPGEDDSTSILGSCCAFFSRCIKKQYSADTSSDELTSVEQPRRMYTAML